MMKSLINYIFFIVIGLGSAVITHAEDKKAPRDSVSFGYSFRAGDTLIYRAVSTDSIMVNYTDPLVKKRYEKYRIVCDSVSATGHFFLNIAMIEFVSYESQGKKQNIRKPNDPWKNRKAFIEIDSVGNRYSCSIDDSSRVCNAPGGVFQPYILFSYGATRKAIKDTWFFSSSEFLPENGTTIPDASHKVLISVEPNIDTLGQKCTKLQFEKTGRGRTHLVNDEQKVAVAAVLNGGGRVYISKEFNLPVYFNYGQQQRVQMAVPNKPDVPIMHIQMTDWSLEKFNRMKEAKGKNKKK